jgi:hypothetical protein
MKTKVFLSTILFIALLCSCEKTQFVEFTLENKTNDTIIVTIVEGGMSSVSQIYPQQIISSASSAVDGDEHNPSKCKIKYQYKDKLYEENSIASYRITNKNEYIGASKWKNDNSYYYLFHLTEEYILSLPEVE